MKRKAVKISEMQKELLNKVGGEELSLEARIEKVAEVLGAGINLDERLMVVPTPDNLRAKIAKDFVEVKREIDEQRRAGRHVLYIPGSYDLVHAGHASYALQITDQYLKQHPELTRDDVFVVMLSDDDELIATVKAYKRKGFSAKGDEEFARPIESAAAFADKKLSVHPRLLETASLPVDLVGFIPAPTNAKDFIKELLGAQNLGADRLREDLEKFMDQRSLSEIDIKELTAAIGSYEKLLHHLGNGGYEEVVASFQALGEPYAEVDPAAPWSIQSFQLFNHTYLASGDGFKAPFVRIVSKKDDKYKDQVDYLMTEAGVTVEEIDDVEVVSTTKLLKTFGPDELLAAKKRHFDDA